MSDRTVNRTGTTSRTLRELVEAARWRDADAYEELIRRHENVVWFTIRRFRLNNADAHDVAQITWLRLVENLDRIRDPERLGSWLATTARRECLRVLGGRDRPIADIAEHVDQQKDHYLPAPEQLVVEKVMALMLWGQVASLPARGQALVWALAGPTYRGIGSCRSRRGCRSAASDPPAGATCASSAASWRTPGSAPPPGAESSMPIAHLMTRRVSLALLMQAAGLRSARLLLHAVCTRISVDGRRCSSVSASSARRCECDTVPDRCVEAGGV